ncbi:MAG: TIM barrel protein [Candidatus Woesearchaeota archaeon]
MTFTKLNFGTAGIPGTTSIKGTDAGVREVRKLGLDAMEIEFVRGVYMNEKNAQLVKKAASESDVALTVHAPYYINLASADPKIRHASVQRIIESAVIGDAAGAFSVTFHAAYYQKQDSEKIYQQVKKYAQEILGKLKEKGCGISIRPETTGKETQWGNIREIIRLSQELENVLPCVDFAHLHARTGGKENSYPEFRNTLELLEKELGRKVLDNMHIHISGINYSEKGEKNHLQLPDSDLKYKELLKVFKEFRIKGSVISESPVPMDDALLIKREYEKI